MRWRKCAQGLAGAVDRIVSAKSDGSLGDNYGLYEAFMDHADPVYGSAVGQYHRRGERLGAPRLRVACTNVEQVLTNGGASVSLLDPLPG